jgi:hypothetical protein
LQWHIAPESNALSCIKVSFALFIDTKCVPQQLAKVIPVILMVFNENENDFVNVSPLTVCTVLFSIPRKQVLVRNEIVSALTVRQIAAIHMNILILI